MKQFILAGYLVVFASVYFDMPTALAQADSAPKVRKFTFHYRFRVKGLKPTDDATDLVRVWLPRPSSSGCQEIIRLESTAPSEISETLEPRFGNRFLYFQTRVPAAGEFTVDIPYEVVRQEVLGSQSLSKGRPVEKLDEASRMLYLSADKLVPTSGKPLKLLEAVELRKDRVDLARQLYDLVDSHVAYKKEGTGWGRGDTNWVCDSRYGNCSDFHSLFISLARSQGLPARFEMGFTVPANPPEGKITGYHCWAWFYVDGRGWIPVDISEADKHPEMTDYYFGNLTADRVTFSTGRDLELVPKSSQPMLNFFINPHIEFRGETLPSESVELQFSFKEKS
jgi:transglutaminase-like putative cysteine protease